MWRVPLFYSEGELDDRATMRAVKRFAGITTTETSPNRREEEQREEVKDVEAAHSSSLDVFSKQRAIHKAYITITSSSFVCSWVSIVISWKGSHNCREFLGVSFHAYPCSLVQVRLDFSIEGVSG